VRLRSQFIVLIAAGALFAGAAFLTLAWTVRDNERVAAQQASAQAVSRDVLGLLALTQQYVLYGESRSAAQWHLRRAAASQALGGEALAASADARTVRQQLELLPELFGALEQSIASTAAVEPKRRGLLIDSLIAGTQAIADDAHSWAEALSAQRATSERRLILVAIALPALLMLMVSLGAVLLAQRVLRPVGELRAAMARVAAGDLGVRSAGGARDEIGDLARGFDEMTARLQAGTEALARNEAWLRAVVDSVPARLAYIDTSLRYRMINSQLARAFHREPAEMLGRNAREVRSETDWTDVAPRFDAALRGQAQRWERVEQHGGQTRYYDAALVPDFDAAGRVVGVYVTGFDITERKRQEAELHRADQHLRLLVDNIRDYAIYLLDAEGRVATWNPGAERNKGYTAQEAIGSHFRRFFTAEDQADGVPERELAQAAAEGRFEAEGWRVRADGTRFWAGVVLNPIRDESGRVSGFTKVTRDLSERQRQVDLLARIAESAPNAMVMAGADGRIRMVNAQAEALFGAPRAELLGRGIDTLMPERYRDAHRAGFARLPQMRKLRVARDLYALRGDGSEVPVDISIAPIDTADGPAALASLFDLTERHARQAEMERSLRDKEVLLKEIHHRVKNNMQVISSLLQLQAGYIDNGEAKLVFEESQHRIRSMALVHEKLYQRHDLSRIEMADYVQALVAMLLSAYGERARTVTVDVHAEAVTLDIDRAVPTGLILNELISNAFKHAFPGGRSGRLQITIAPRDGGVHLAVRDDGVGVPAGVDIANSTSLGLRLVRILSDQVGAELTFITDHGFGCELQLGPQTDKPRE
jgi:PAS domain S-box-containing protein